MSLIYSKNNAGPSTVYFSVCPEADILIVEIAFYRFKHCKLDLI
jgi:hypothetical protein